MIASFGDWIERGGKGVGRFESLKVGRFEGSKVRRLEGWKVGRFESLKVGRLKVGGCRA